MNDLNSKICDRLLTSGGATCHHLCDRWLSSLFAEIEVNENPILVIDSCAWPT